MTEKIGGQLGLFPHPFFSKSSDKNLEIAKLFSIVERPNNPALRDIMIAPQQPLGKGPSVIRFAHCLRIVFATVKYAFIFRGDEFSAGGKFPGDEIFQVKFYIGGIC